MSPKERHRRAAYAESGGNESVLPCEKKATVLEKKDAPIERIGKDLTRLTKAGKKKIIDEKKGLSLVR